MKQSYLPIKDFDLNELEKRAIKTLQLFQPKDRPYYGCFSGGKDSVVIKELARRAGVEVVWYYNVTTIDPPELVRFIKKEHSDVVWNRPKHGNFFKRMEKKGFPTRRNRWCCREYKESTNPIGETLILGVRAAESKARSKRWQVVTHHNTTQTKAISPIIAWRDDHVWDYIKSNSIKYCDLYNEGFDRLGCVGCPLSRTFGKKKQFEKWPRFEMLWRRAFNRLWEKRVNSKQPGDRVWFGEKKFASADEMFLWWLNDDPLPSEDDDCQGFLDLMD